MNLFLNGNFNNREIIKKLLSNIENLNEEERKQLKEKIMRYSSIDTSDSMMNLYNQLSEAGSKALIDLVGYRSLTDEFITKFKNIQYILPPYNKSNYFFYYIVFKSKELSLIALNSDIFYDNIKSMDEIQYIYNDLLDDELKRLFISKCTNIIKNILPPYSSNHSFYYFVFKFKELSLIALNSDIFYEGLNSIDEIQSIFGYLQDDELKKIFISKCTNIIKNILSPYSSNHSFYYFVFKFKELSLMALNSNIFYDGLNSISEIESIFVSLLDDELKKLFISKCSNIIKNILPPYSSNHSFYYFVFKSKELSLMALNSDIFYDNLKSNFEIESIFEKLIDDELKRLFISKYFNIIGLNNIIRNIKFYSPQFKLFIKNNISDDIIINYLKSNDLVDEVLNAFTLLSNNSQEIVYRSNWFREKVNLDLLVNQEFLLANGTDSIIKDIADKIKSSTHFMELYSESKPKNMLFLKLFLDKYDNDYVTPRQFSPIYDITNQMYELLGNEYQDKLKSFIKKLDKNAFLELYFSYYITFDNQSLELKNVMYKRASELLTDNMITNSLSSYIIKSNDQELLNLVISHISREDLLMLSIRNEYVCDIVLELLRNDPSYFKDIIINDNMKYYISNNLTDNQVNKYLQIFKYLDEEQYNLYFIPIFIEKMPVIKNYYKKSIIENPDNIIKLSDLEYVPDDILNIIKKMSIEKLIDCITCQCGNIKNIVDNIKNGFNSRIYEVVEFINSNLYIYDTKYMDATFSGILYLVYEPDTFIKSLTNTELLCRLLIDINNKSIKKLLINQLVNIYNQNGFNLELSLPYFFEDEEQEQFISSLNFDVLLNIICTECRYDNYSSNRYKPYINSICNKIDNDINILFSDINSIIMIENLLLYLPNEYREKVKNYIDNKYNIYIKQYNNLGKYLKTYSDKANFIIAVEACLINPNNIDEVYNLLDKNIYLFNSMDFNLLNDDIKKMGTHFVEKTSRYPIIASKLFKIYSSDLNKFNLIISLSNKLIKENSETIYDQKIETIINYLYSNSLNIDFEIDDKALTNIENYILDNNSNFKNLNVNNYILERNSIIEEKINNCNNIEDLQNYVFERYFWLSSKEIEEFLISYAYNFNSVVEFCESNLPNKYINYIKTIKEITDIDELKRIIPNLYEFTLSDFMIIKGIMIKAYNKSIIHDIKNMQNGNSITLNISGEEIEATELTSNFGIFAHSTCAYGTMPIINDDYYDSWNYNPNTSNHGICTILFTEYSYGTPAITDTGVLFGFFVDDESIPLIAPYDLGTINTGYNIKSTMKPFFGRINTISNNTRHTHSEASLERRVTDKFNYSSIRQPNCIIILEDMPDSIKENSLKAYHDFKKHGIDLEIKYINRKKIATNASIKLSNMIKDYLNNYDLEMLRTIINLYECNLCSSTFIGKRKSNSLELYDEDELFFTKEITDILNQTINILEQSHDINEINHFIEVMESEQFKFDLVNDFNKKRSNKFDLYTSYMKDRVNALKKKIVSMHV